MTDEPRHRIALAIALGLALATSFSRIEGDWPIVLVELSATELQQEWEPACHVDILLDFKDAGIICHIGNMFEKIEGACEALMPGSSRVCGSREKMLWEREALFPKLRIKELSGALKPRRI